MVDFWEIGIGRRIRYQIHNIIFLAVAGLAFIFLLPLFGLPSFALLGMAFFLWSFYIVFPNEREVKADILKEIYDSMNYNPSSAAPPPDITPFANDLRELVAKAPSLIIRSIFKISIFVLAILQFFTFNRLIALILSFIFYFMLPGRFKESQINKALESFIRIPLSIFMAWLFLVTFGGNEVGVALAFLGLAFFFNFPVTIEEDDKKELRFKISSISFKGSESRTFDRLVFGLLMLASLLFSGIWNMGTTTLWVFGVIWLISLISGWSAGPEGKPGIGILMIIIALFAFATTYTGVMGQAIFGYWWPQVYSATEYVGGIFEPIWIQTQKTFSDSWLLLTNPAAYYERMMKETQATKTVVKTGGTTRSIELVKFDIFTSVDGYIDPFIDPVVGSVELENQGEFIADRINLTVQPVWVDPEKLTEIAIGKFSRFECSKPTAQYPDKGTCSWPGPGSEQVTYPKEIKMSSFVINSSYFDEGTWKSNSINLADCEKCENDKCTNKIDCACDDPDALYKHANQIIKFNSIYNYDYNVNVSIDAEIIDANLYFELLKAREITLEDFTSQYSGGPVKATIWSQKQPVRAGDISLFVFSVYNDGTGKLKKINNAKVKVPSNLGKVEKVSSTFKIGTSYCKEKDIDCSVYDDGNNCESIEGCIWTGIAFDDPEGKCVKMFASCSFYDRDFCEKIPICEWIREDMADGCEAAFKCDGEYCVIECKHTLESIKTGDFVRLSFFITPRSDITEDKITSLIIGLANYEYEKTESKSLSIANNPLH